LLPVPVRLHPHPQLRRRLQELRQAQRCIGSDATLPKPPEVLANNSDRSTKTGPCRARGERVLLEYAGRRRATSAPSRTCGSCRSPCTYGFVVGSRSSRQTENALDVPAGKEAPSSCRPSEPTRSARRLHEGSCRGLKRLKVPFHDAPHETEVDAEVGVCRPIPALFTSRSAPRTRDSDACDEFTGSPAPRPD
jgi:hypothetical protein